MVEFVIAQEDAWKKLVLDEEGLGPWTGCSQYPDGRYYIQLGNDTDENNIEQCLNHEMIHYLMYIMKEEHTTIDRIYYTYRDSMITNEMKHFLQDLVEYGFGYPGDIEKA